MTAPDQLNSPITDAGDESTVYCTVHPTIATHLHCNRCGRPMCTRCAVLTPVGYRCKQCVRQQQNTYFNAQTIDYILTAGATLVIGFGAAFVMSLIGWFIIAFFVGPAVGGAIGRVI